jgi:hypothetical protein
MVVHMRELEECHVQFQNEVDSMKMIVKVEDEYVHSQNVVDSVKIITKVEDDTAAHSQNEIDLMKIMMERSPLIFMEQTLDDPASMEPLLRWCYLGKTVLWLPTLQVRRRRKFR